MCSNSEIVIKEGDKVWKCSVLGTAGTEIHTYRRSRFTKPMGRRTRTVLPVKPSLLTPDKLKVDVPSVLREKQKEKRKYYDGNTKQFEPLKPGDQVRIRTEKKTWEPAIVENKTPEPRSYIVKIDRGELDSIC